MLAKILGYGSVAGLIVAVPLFGIANGEHSTGPWAVALGYLTMLVALSIIFIAVKRHRDRELGGVIRFGPAFAYGLAISVVAAIFYVLAWELAMAGKQQNFAAAYAAGMIAEQKARGVTGPALAEFIAEMERFKTQYGNPLFRLPMTFAEIFPVGLLVSLVSAGLLRNSRFLPARRSAPAYGTPDS